MKMWCFLVFSGVFWCFIRLVAATSVKLTPRSSCVCQKVSYCSKVRCQAKDWKSSLHHQGVSWQGTSRRARSFTLNGVMSLDEFKGTHFHNMHEDTRESKVLDNWSWTPRIPPCCSTRKPRVAWWTRSSGSFTVAPSLSVIFLLCTATPINLITSVINRSCVAKRKQVRANMGQSLQCNQCNDIFRRLEGDSGHTPSSAWLTLETQSGAAASRYLNTHNFFSPTSPRQATIQVLAQGRSQEKQGQDSFDLFLVFHRWQGLWGL